MVEILNIANNILESLIQYNLYDTSVFDFAETINAYRAEASKTDPSVTPYLTITPDQALVIRKDLQQIRDQIALIDTLNKLNQADRFNGSKAL